MRRGRVESVMRAGAVPALRTRENRMTGRQIPTIVTGTIESSMGRGEGGAAKVCLSFLCVAPLVLIPMQSNAYTTMGMGAKTNGLRESDIRRARLESEEVARFVQKLSGTEGVTRLWITPGNVIAEGDTTKFSKIGSAIRAALTEVFGEIQFHDVEHGEAKPFIFDYGAIKRSQGGATATGVVVG